MSSNAVADPGAKVHETAEAHMKAFDFLPRPLRVILANSVIDWAVTGLPRQVREHGLIPICRSLVEQDAAEAGRYAAEAATGKCPRSLKLLYRNPPPYVLASARRQKARLLELAGQVQP